jgi:ppGpp synthetase/RelA/SpoT-type nucleotidyltranferase
MLDKQTFFKEYRIDDAELEKLGFKWDALATIYADYLRRHGELSHVAETISKRLGQIPEVHSLKSRIKDPAHLIEKIVRKRRKEPDHPISIANYRTEITDLIGVRALHLFKDEWAAIHRGISECWELVEGQKPTAYIRKGDDSKAFAAEGCEVTEHERGYRSVHYLVKCQPTKTPSVVEIQVRTIFEEGWSEIDHRIAYPYSVDDQLLSGYLAVFNVLAGNADQMATFIRILKTGLAKSREEQTASTKGLQAAISRLEKLEKELGAERGEKARLKEILETLRKSQPFPTPTIFASPSSPFLSGSTSSSPFGFTSSSALNLLQPQLQHCKVCGADLGPMLSNILPRRCPRCGALN